MTWDNFRGMSSFDLSKNQVTNQKLRDLQINRNYEKRSTFTYHKHVFHSDSFAAIYSRTIISSSSGVNRKKRMFDSFVFLPLSTRAYFKGTAYVKIILKNHATSYFAGGSYYRRNTVVLTTEVMKK